MRNDGGMTGGRPPPARLRKQHMSVARHDVVLVDHSALQGTFTFTHLVAGVVAGLVGSRVRSGVIEARDLTNRVLSVVQVLATGVGESKFNHH